MKIVLDTNVLLSGAFYSGAPARVVDACTAREVQLVVSPNILAEYRRAGTDFALGRPQVDFESLLAIVVEAAILVSPGPVQHPRCADPEDDKFIECAAAGAADCIVSGDKALLAMDGVLDVPVLSPREFAVRHLGGAGQTGERRRRETDREAEDHEDIEDARKALAEPGRTPWKKFKDNRKS